MSPQGATAVESAVFNNQMESGPAASLNGSLLPLPMNGWGVFPMMGYHPSGMFYWYS
jgi:hypothetical protein